MAKNPEEVDVHNVPAPLNRDELRAQIFAKEKMALKTVPLPFNGVELEFRQPTIAQSSALESGDDNDSFIIRAIIAFTYIPGTDEKVFEDADYDMLNSMPMGGSFQNAVKVIQEVLDIKVDEKVKN